MDGSPDTPERTAAERTLHGRLLALDVQAMPAQVALLNRHQLSLAEYRWLGEKVVEAFGQKAQESIARMVANDQATINGPPENTAAVLAKGKPATGSLRANVDLLSDFDDTKNYLAGSGIGF
jgi:hypothetical protein